LGSAVIAVVLLRQSLAVLRRITAVAVINTYDTLTLSGSYTTCLDSSATGHR